MRRLCSCDAKRASHRAPCASRSCSESASTRRAADMRANARCSTRAEEEDEDDDEEEEAGGEKKERSRARAAAKSDVENCTYETQFKSQHMETWKNGE
jgi:hypothetical protein